MLDVRVRLPLDPLHDEKAGLHEMRDHRRRHQEPEVQRHRGPPELVAVHDLLADVKRDEEEPAGRQDPPQLAQGGPHLGRRCG